MFYHICNVLMYCTPKPAIGCNTYKRVLFIIILYPLGIKGSWGLKTKKVQNEVLE